MLCQGVIGDYFSANNRRNTPLRLAPLNDLLDDPVGNLVCVFAGPSRPGLALSLGWRFTLWHGLSLPRWTPECKPPRIQTRTLPPIEPEVRQPPPSGTIGP